MSTKKTAFPIGTSEVNGYVINVIRMVSAQATSETGRVPARYFGEIVSPDGTKKQMGENGMTVTQIKRFIGIKSSNNGTDKRLTELESIKAKLLELSLPTIDIDEKIEDLKNEIAETNKAKKAEKIAKALAKAKELQSTLEELSLANNDILSIISALEVTYNIYTEEN